MRAEFVVDRKETLQSLADRNHIPYQVLNPDDPKLTLTIRDHSDSARRVVPRETWQIENRSRIVLPGRFRARQAL